ncbi:MAG: VCBS repeat-containing protein [Puniceicoccaceae bacterium]|nr:MAG: VCBS repeat-containing protein [Puniceicoccaceae bacterium]
MVRSTPSPLVFTILAAGLFLSGCGSDPSTPATDPFSNPWGLAFTPHTVGEAATGTAWIANLLVIDLDGDGRDDIVACDAHRNTIVWLHQQPDGTLVEKVLATGIPAPAHVSAHDMTGNGHLDLLIPSMGTLFPNDEPIGAVYILENDGRQNFTPRRIIDTVARPTDVQAADFTGNGLPDLAVAHFGYHEGYVSWLENHGDGRFELHRLLDLSGTIHARVGDVTGNGHPDIVALVSQEWEEIHLFENHGGGRFEGHLLWGSGNEDYGLSHLVLVDFNRNGRLDIVFSNGDGMDYGPPHSRPWHGLQWLENTGEGFTYHRIGDYAGVYGLAVLDLTGDGYLDLICSSVFNDWTRPDAWSVKAFINDGAMNFTPVPLAREPTHLVTLGVGDFNGNGLTDFVTGTLNAFNQPHSTTTRFTLWERLPPPPDGSP